MPFNWPLLMLVIAVAGCVLGASFTGIYFLNKSIDRTGR
jgi:hypothetical protein